MTAQNITWFYSKEVRKNCQLLEICLTHDGCHVEHVLLNTMSQRTGVEVIMCLGSLGMSDSSILCHTYFNELDYRD